MDPSGGPAAFRLSATQDAPLPGTALLLLAGLGGLAGRGRLARHR
jgi:hypothetical protein